MKRMEKKLEENYTRMRRAALNKCDTVGFRELIKRINWEKNNHAKTEKG